VKHLIDDETLKKEINLVKDLKGSATGRLVLGETTASVKVGLDISEIDLFAEYGRMPYPLEIKGGHFSYDETTFQVKSLRGKMQNSTFSGLSAEVKLGESPHLEVQSGRILISLGDIYEWLSSIEEFKATLKEVESVKGKVAISSIGLKGPLEEPKKWQFKMLGKVEKLTTVSTLTPGPVVVSDGRIEVNHKSMSITGAQTSMLDAKLTVSGIQHGYLVEGFQSMDFSFSGDIGPHASQWLSDFAELPPKLRMQPPLFISGAKLGWNKSGNISFSGALKKKGWPNVSIDMLVKPGELLIKKLTLQDEKSDATIDLKLKKGELHLGFKGLLDKTTLDALLVENQILAGRIQGNFEAHILKDQPMRSSAEGTLRGTGLGYPLNLKVPLIVDEFALNAIKSKLEVKSASITLGDSHLNLEGNVDFSEKDFKFDMTVSGDELEWEELEQTLNQEKQESGSEEPNESDFPPIRGTLQVEMESFKYHRVTLSPLHADIHFDHDRFRVTVNETEFCGISTPGTIEVTPEGLSLEFRPFSKDQPINPIINCLLDQEYRMTGDFDLKSRVAARGKEEALLQALEGNLEMVAKEGRLYEDPMIGKAFAYLKATKAFKGRLPEMKEEGVPFDTITTKAEFQDGKLLLNSWVLDGPSVYIAAQGEMDLRDRTVDVRVVVAPLRRVDSVVSKIPLVNRILAGTLVSVPIRIRGDLANPRVIPLSPAMVGSSLLGIVKNTLTLPFELIPATIPAEEEQPTIPGEEEEQADPRE
jgi:hypothetical protein